MLILTKTEEFCRALADEQIAVRASGYAEGCQYAFATDRGRIVIPWEVIERGQREWSLWLKEIAALPARYTFTPEAAKAPPGG